VSALHAPGFPCRADRRWPSAQAAPSAALSTCKHRACAVARAADLKNYVEVEGVSIAPNADPLAGIGVHLSRRVREGCQSGVKGRSGRRAAEAGRQLIPAGSAGLMPYAPKRPCARPYCPRLLDHGEECPEHGPTARNRENDRQPKRAQKRKFYQTPEWRTFREDILVRDPVCRIKDKCAPKGAPSTCVDHVIPIEAGGEPLDPRNAQGACWPCHSAKTAREDGGFGNRVRRSA
jgi:5-methylcytosine-specific restriction protein A